MEIQDLIANDTFSFNAHFKIFRYEPPDIGSDEEGESFLEYDSDSGDEIPPSIFYQYITAINQDEDGSVSIEYIDGAIF